MRVPTFEWRIIFSNWTIAPCAILQTHLVFLCFGPLCHLEHEECMVLISAHSWCPATHPETSDYSLWSQHDVSSQGTRCAEQTHWRRGKNHLLAGGLSSLGCWWLASPPLHCLPPLSQQQFNNCSNFACSEGRAALKQALFKRLASNSCLQGMGPSKFKKPSAVFSLCKYLGFLENGPSSTFQTPKLSSLVAALFLHAWKLCPLVSFVLGQL